MDVEPEELLVDKWNETSTSNASMFEYEIGNGTVVLPHFNQTVEGGFIGEDFLREPAMVALAVFALCIPVVCIIGTLVIIRSYIGLCCPQKSGSKRHRLTRSATSEDLSAFQALGNKSYYGGTQEELGMTRDTSVDSRTILLAPSVFLRGAGGEDAPPPPPMAHTFMQQSGVPPSAVSRGFSFHSASELTRNHAANHSTQSITVLMEESRLVVEIEETDEVSTQSITVLMEESRLVVEIEETDETPSPPAPPSHPTALPMSPLAALTPPVTSTPPLQPPSTPPAESPPPYEASVDPVLHRPTPPPQWSSTGQPPESFGMNQSDSSISEGNPRSYCYGNQSLYMGGFYGYPVDSSYGAGSDAGIQCGGGASKLPPPAHVFQAAPRVPLKPSTLTVLRHQHSEGESTNSSTSHRQSDSELVYMDDAEVDADEDDNEDNNTDDEEDEDEEESSEEEESAPQESKEIWSTGAVVHADSKSTIQPV